MKNQSLIQKVIFADISAVCSEDSRHQEGMAISFEGYLLRMLTGVDRSFIHYWRRSILSEVKVQGIRSLTTLHNIPVCCAQVTLPCSTYSTRCSYYIASLVVEQVGLLAW